jgi:SAM-dependent methyltransferase
MTWWADLYDDALADLLLTRDDDLAATLRFLVDELALRPGDRVFDQCCGIGRLAVPLARWGARVTGVEQAARYVERAHAAARAAGIAIEVTQGDAFAYVPAPCHAAFKWWTSFGYLPDDDGNVRMLQRAFEAVVPGGRFALDFLNAPGVLAHFRPHEVTRASGIELVRESRLDLARGLLHKTWKLALADGTRVERPSTVRLYAPDRLAELFARAGFANVALYGSLDRSALTLDSPRCIVVGTRP